MTFASVEFLFFLPVALLIHWLLPRRAAWQNAWLLFCGHVFYATWDHRLLVLLWATIGVDFAIGRALERNAERPIARKRLLRASIVWNVGLLCVFKYAGFFVESARSALVALGVLDTCPDSAAAHALDLVLPMGISYFTLQKLSYVIDVHDRRLPACRSLPRFATWVMFFPHMVAGPITRAIGFLPQLEKPRTLLASDLSRAGLLFLIGFTEKACFTPDAVFVDLQIRLMQPVLDTTETW